MLSILRCNSFVKEKNQLLNMIQFLPAISKDIDRLANPFNNAQVKGAGNNLFAIAAHLQHFAPRVDQCGMASELYFPCLAHRVDTRNKHLIFNGASLVENIPMVYTNIRPLRRNKQYLNPLQRQCSDQFSKAHIIAYDQTAFYAIQFKRNRFVSKCKILIFGQRSKQVRLVILGNTFALLSNTKEVL